MKLKLVKDKLLWLKNNNNRLNLFKRQTRIYKIVKVKYQNNKMRKTRKKRKIGIEWLLIRLIFKNKKKKLKEKRNKFNRKQIKYFWINKLNKNKRFNNMKFMLKRLM